MLLDILNGKCNDDDILCHTIGAYERIALSFVPVLPGCSIRWAKCKLIVTIVKSKILYDTLIRYKGDTYHTHFILFCNF